MLELQFAQMGRRFNNVVCPFFASEMMCPAWNVNTVILRRKQHRHGTSKRRPTWCNQTCCRSPLGILCFRLICRPLLTFVTTMSNKYDNIIFVLFVYLSYFVIIGFICTFKNPCRKNDCFWKYESPGMDANSPRLIICFIALMTNVLWGFICWNE